MCIKYNKENRKTEKKKKKKKKKTEVVYNLIGINFNILNCTALVYNYYYSTQDADDRR